MLKFEKIKFTSFKPRNGTTNEMKKICLKTSPYACCIVPERREELTTEGGLDVKSNDLFT